MPTGTSDAYEELRTLLKGRIFWVLFPLFLAFTYFVFPEVSPAQQTGTKPDGLVGRLGSLLEVIGRVASAGVLAPAFSFLLSATDPLFHGKSPAAHFIRGLLPSNLAKDQYHCTDHEATDLWFLYFDTWEQPRSPNARLLNEASKRTYGARLIFYLQRALLLVFGACLLLFILVLALPALSHPFGDYVAVRATMLAIMAIALVILHVTNRVHPGPWGCWRKVEEAFGMQRARFKRDVLDRAQNLPEAIELVRRIREGLEHEPPAQLPRAAAPPVAAPPAV